MATTYDQTECADLFLDAVAAIVSEHQKNDDEQRAVIARLLAGELAVSVALALPSGAQVSLGEVFAP